MLLLKSFLKLFIIAVFSVALDIFKVGLWELDIEFFFLILQKDATCQVFLL